MVQPNFQFKCQSVALSVQEVDAISHLPKQQPKHVMKPTAPGLRAAHMLSKLLAAAVRFVKKLRPGRQNAVVPSPSTASNMQLLPLQTPRSSRGSFIARLPGEPLKYPA